MNDQPLISIIIPTYNRAHLIGRSIKSVISQTYQNLDIIVVDDGSIDNTEEVVNSFQDSRIHYIKHENNRGVSAARNTGIKLAKGQYVAFQDSDDEWLPEKLEKQLALFTQNNSPNLGLVVCGYSVIRETGTKRTYKRINPLSYKELLSHFTGYGEATQRFILKRDITSSELYFDENLPAWEEWDLLFRISRTCHIGVANEPLVKYYRHSGPHVDIPSNRIRARKMLIRKYSSELGSCSKGLSYAQWQLALDYFQTGNIERVRLHLRKAIKANPWNLDYHLQYLAAIYGKSMFQLVFSFRHVIAASVKHLTSHSKRDNL